MTLTRRPDDRHLGLRLGAYAGPLQIEKPFAIPDSAKRRSGVMRLCLGIASQPMPIFHTQV